MADYEDYDYTKPMSLGIWKKMLPFLLPQKKLLIQSTFFMLSAALVDVFWPLLLGYIIRHNIEPRSLDGIGWLLTAAIVLIFVQGVIVYFFVDIGVKIEMGIGRDLRDAVFLHLQKLGLAYYNTTPVGYMMARTNSDTTRIG